MGCSCHQQGQLEGTCFAHCEGVQASVEEEVLPSCQALPQQIMLRADANQPGNALHPAMHAVTFDLYGARGGIQKPFHHLFKQEPVITTLGICEISHRLHS